MKQSIQCLWVLVGLGSTTAAQDYNIVDIGQELGAVHQSWALDINEQGDVVGLYVSEDTVRNLGFTWRRGTSKDHLPQPFDGAIQPPVLAEVLHHSGPVAINDGGLVVGNALEAGGSSVASGYFSFLDDDQEFVSLHALLPLVPFEDKWVSDLSNGIDSVLVVGTREYFDLDNFRSGYRGFIVELDPELGSSPIQEIGALGGEHSYIEAINDEGVIVGSAETVDRRSRAFLSTDRVHLQDLGTLGGATSGALDVGPDAKVVGWAETASGREHAFVFHDGVMQDLGTLGGSTSRALGIDSTGTLIVGSALDEAGEPRAVLWNAGEIVDLNERVPELGWRLIEATAVNRHGEIVGWGVAPDGRHQAFLLERVDLGLGSLQPGVAGEINTVSASGATAGGLVAFLAAPDREGYIDLPNCTAGLLLHQPRLLGVSTADGGGAAEIGVTVPLSLVGFMYRLQALQVAPCSPSLVVRGALE